MSVYRDSPATRLEALGGRLRELGPALSMPPVRAARSLAASLARLRHDGALVERIALSAGLHPTMVRWGLESTLETATEDVLTRLADSVSWGGASPTRMAAVILAGNVFTACVRAVVTPLLFGVPVMVRSSSRDDALVQALVTALDPPFDEAALVVSFPRDDVSRTRALLRHADTAHVYGSDDTIHDVRAAAPPHTLVVPHGHGLGVGFAVGAADAHAFALDVAAYDQRGCFSPHVVYVMGDAGAFAEALFEALEEIEIRMPRGPAPEHILAAQMQWRGSVAALGALHEVPAFAVGVEQDTPLSAGPGWRNVLIREVTDEVDFLDHIRPLGAHLKAIGVAGEDPTVVARMLPYAPGLVPRVCRAGTMQMPPFDLHAEGLEPWHGLLRFVETR